MTDGCGLTISLVKENSSQCAIFLSDSPSLRHRCCNVPSRATYSDSRLHIWYDTVVKPRTSTHPLMTPYSIYSDERGVTTICNDELCKQSTYVQIVYYINTLHCLCIYSLPFGHQPKVIKTSVHSTKVACPCRRGLRLKKFLVTVGKLKSTLGWFESRLG